MYIYKNCGEGKMGDCTILDRGTHVELSAQQNKCKLHFVSSILREVCDLERNYCYFLLFKPFHADLFKKKSPKTLLYQVPLTYYCS